MNAPRRPDGPPVRDGKPYSAIAHLAEDVVPYVALAAGLRDRNLSAPTILHADLDRGLIIMEDLGDERIVGGDPPAPIEARYEAAIDLLVALHRRKLPETLPVPSHLDYRLPRYDMEAFLIEAELLLDWYLVSAGAAATDPVRKEFIALWRQALEPAINAPATWVLRDYHSPNLLWLPRTRRRRPDRAPRFPGRACSVRPPTTWPRCCRTRASTSRNRWKWRCSAAMCARGSTDQRFDAAAFTRLYATLAAQRATKILGIFARLDRRDGKPQYLRHMPRLLTYLSAVAGASGAGRAQGLVCRQSAAERRIKRRIERWVMMARIGDGLGGR